MLRKRSLTTFNLNVMSKIILCNRNRLAQILMSELETNKDNIYILSSSELFQNLIFFIITISRIDLFQKLFSSENFLLKAITF